MIDNELRANAAVTFCACRLPVYLHRYIKPVHTQRQVCEEQNTQTYSSVLRAMHQCSNIKVFQELPNKAAQTKSAQSTCYKKQESYTMYVFL